MTVAANSTRPPRLLDLLTWRSVSALTLVPLTTLALGAAMTSSVAAAADTSPPTQPGTITVSAVTATSATLTWARSTDNVKVEGYRVSRGPAAASPAQLSLIATTDAITSYKATRLRSATSYQFAVSAIDLADNISVLRTVTFQTAASTDTTAPSVPSSSSVNAKAFSSSRIDVMWAASTSADTAGYQILRDGLIVGQVDLPGGLRFSDGGLAAASSHRYVIKAVDSAGNISSGTSGRLAQTLPNNTVLITRGPYVSRDLAGSATVSWWTNIPSPGAVGFGTSSTSEHTVVDTSGAVQHHAVVVSGLGAGTRYLYSVTSGSASATGDFATPAGATSSFSFAAIGDFGGASPGESQNAANIASANTAFIQTVGDNIYPSAGLPDPDYNKVYSDFDARFFKQFGTALRSQPFFPANGNQEYFSDGEFWNAFPMPGTNHSWYSYDWGAAHILVLDAEQPVTVGSDQYNFVKADLAGPNSSAARWRIVIVQRPPYSSSSAAAPSLPVQQNLVPLFDLYGVALVLSGNSHNYERSLPMRGGKVVNSAGTTYVVTGGGGNGFNAFALPQPDWSAFREASYYEYARITVAPSSLTVEAIRADTNAAFDSVTLR